MSDQPSITVTVTSPIGTVRAWIADDGGVRTAITCEFGGEEAEATAADAMAQVLAQASSAIRGLTARSSAPVPLAAFTDWMAERCVLEPASRELAADLYADFVAWSRERGRERVMTAGAFGNALRDRQIALAGKNAKGLKYRGGLRLLPRRAPEAPTLQAVV